MTKVKKLLKKAFTLVELVVVVAIIAILSGVSVAAYVGITDRANKASDQETVAQLNHQLAAMEAINGKNPTCFDAVKDVFETGLDLELLRPSTKNAQFVWDQDNDRFAIINKDLEVVAEDSTLKLTSNQHHRWVLSNKYEINKNKNAIYLLEGFEGGDFNFSTSIDTGINNDIGALTFVAPETAPQGDIIVRTNMIESILKFDISATQLASTNLIHYGALGSVTNMISTSTNKYVERGTVARMRMKTCNVEITEDATIYQIQYDNGTQPQVSAALRSTIYDPSGNKNPHVAEEINTRNTNFNSMTQGTVSLHAYHKDYAEVIDAKSVYQICKGCGKTLAIGKSNSTNTYFSRIFSVGSTVTYKHLSIFDIDSAITAGYTISNYQIKAPAGSTTPYTGLQYEAGMLTREQRLCSHENIKYTADSEHPEDFHIVTCEDCGYSYKTIHTHGDVCENCNKNLHNWVLDGDVYKCTEHDGKSFYGTYDDTTKSGTVFKVWYCNGNVKISGYNDASFTYMNSDDGVHLETLLQSAIGSDFKSDLIDNLAVEFLDATYIPTYFTTLSQVTKVVVPSTLQKIGNNALSGTSIKEFLIPSTVTSIGIRAFNNCKNLATITVPGSVETLNEGVFKLCRFIDYVVVSEGVKRIELEAFNQCYGLTTISLPSTLTSIEKTTAFYTCTRLSKIKYNGTKAKWLSTVNNGSIIGPKQLIIQCTDGDIVNNDLA